MDLTELTLEANGTATLTATVDPEGWVGQLIWSTSDSTVATVNQSGVVTWVGEGTCTITASASGVLATCTVTCEAEVVEVVSDLIVRSYGNETSDVTLKVGESVTFTVEGGDGVNYTWSVEDSSIATIGSASGTCVGVSEGKTVVTVTSGDMTAEVVVRIAAAN